MNIEQTGDGELVAEVEELGDWVDQQMTHESGGEWQQRDEHQEDQVDPNEERVHMADEVEGELMEKPEAAGRLRR